MAPLEVFQVGENLEKEISRFPCWTTEQQPDPNEWKILKVKTRHLKALEEIDFFIYI